MWIGTRIGPEWLGSQNDDDLRFLKQVGVDYLSVPLSALRGYVETGCVARDDLKRLVDRLDHVGLKIGRASAFGARLDDAHLGRPGWQRQIEDLCRTVEMLGEVEVPVFSIRCFWAESLVAPHRPGWSRRRGRGGYEYRAFDIDALESMTCQPEARTTADDLWDNLIKVYGEVVPVAERAGVRLAMHGNDPPLYEACGNPQILCRHTDFDRLFSEVPSPNSGMTFCVGTRYESGEDVFAGIEHFGKGGKIFYVDFRNVRGTLPRARGYEEVLVDDGDIGMWDVVRALHKAGYDGVLDVDHVVELSGDTPLGHRHIAFAAGYIKGLLAGLPKPEWRASQRS